MSASFIDRAPTPVVRLLSNDPGTTITNMRIVGYHTTMLGLSTRRSCQINKPRRWHTPILAGAEPTFGKNARKVNTPICAHIATPKKTPKSTPRYCWRNRTPSWPISTPLRMQLLASRPDNFETTAIAEIINCSTLLPTVPLHIVHLATTKLCHCCVLPKPRGCR